MYIETLSSQSAIYNWLLTLNIILPNLFYAFLPPAAEQIVYSSCLYLIKRSYYLDRLKCC